MPGRKMGYGDPQFDVADRRARGVDRNGRQRLNLRQENAVFGGTGGVSENNRLLGFRPAYRNQATGQIAMRRAMCAVCCQRSTRASFATANSILARLLPRQR